MKVHRLISSLKYSMIMLTQIIVIFVVINLGLYCLPNHEDDRSRELIFNQYLQKYGWDTLKKSYPGKTESQIKQLLTATGSQSTRYYPYVEFIDDHVLYGNTFISSEGYRSIGADQETWPPPLDGFTIFVFGGSTTLGSGVEDFETAPAYLQSFLRQAFSDRINVYNFGTGAHYSTQEVLFLFDLLRRGITPNLVIFIDGLNDFYFWNDRSVVADFFETSFNESRNAKPGERWKQAWIDLIQESPLGIRVQALSQWLRSKLSPPGMGIALSPIADAYAQPVESGSEAVRRATAVVERYERTIAVAAGMATAVRAKPLFVWQPAPLYHYDLRFHPFEILPGHRLHGVGYPLMRERFTRGDLSNNFLWCADVQQGWEGPLYIDQVHYRPILNALLAHCIAERLAGTLGLLPMPARAELPSVGSVMAGGRAARRTSIDLLALAAEGGLATMDGSARVDTPAPDSLTIRPDPIDGEHYVDFSLPQLEGHDFLLRLVTANSNGLRLQLWADRVSRQNGTIIDLDLASAKVLSTQHIGDLAIPQVTISPTDDGGSLIELRFHATDPTFDVVLQMLGSGFGTRFIGTNEAITVKQFSVRSTGS
jgi:hypothetical protein